MFILNLHIFLKIIFYNDFEKEKDFRRFTYRENLHIFQIEVSSSQRERHKTGKEKEASGMRMCELKAREVINICSGKRLGRIVDVEIDPCSGAVESVIIPGPGRICGFLGTDCEYVIPFGCIRTIGPDTVIVEIQEEKFLQKF